MEDLAALAVILALELILDHMLVADHLEAGVEEDMVVMEELHMFLLVAKTQKVVIQPIFLEVAVVEDMVVMEVPVDMED